MANRKKRKVSEQEMFIKAFRKANRELEMQRNDGKWVATHRIWKNKKAYNRKRDRKFYTDYPFSVLCSANSIKSHLSFQLQALYLPSPMLEVRPRF